MVRRMYRVDVYLRVRRAVMVEGMSIREASRVFGLHRDTVGKMLAYSVPPGYRRQTPPRRPKLEPFAGVIDRILEEDHHAPRKQRHTAKRIFERLRDEYGFDGQYTIVKDYPPSIRLWHSSLSSRVLHDHCGGLETRMLSSEAPEGEQFYEFPTRDGNSGPQSKDPAFAGLGRRSCANM